MFPNDIWIADPNRGSGSDSTKGQIHKLENEIGAITVDCPANATTVMVSQDMMHVYVANLAHNTLAKFRNGVHVDNIPVGSIPNGMCEDGNGFIYVANYGDNTVSKIVNGRVVKVITVPSGPRDVVADSRNNVYVACYLSDKVVQIVNDVVVDEIDCKLAPRALTCDIYDNIWVANYSSNTISKIVNSVKVLDIDLKNIARAPVDIITDSKGIVYIASYLGNSVVRIENTTTGMNVDTIPVPSGPTSLGVTSDNTIYVTSEVDGVIAKIVNGTKVKEISVCQNPVGFGDFTGCATYNIYHDGSTSGSMIPVGGWTMSHMSSQIQVLLGRVQSGTVNTSADLVSYHSATYPTVEAALDNLLNVSPIINSFKVSNDIYEVGSTVSSLQVDWNFNKPMATAEIYMGSVMLADLADAPGDPIPLNGSKVVSGFSITSASTLVLRVTDDAGLVATKTLNIFFENKFLFGTLPDTTTAVAQTELDLLNKSPLVKNPYGLYFKVDCGLLGDQLLCIAVPTSWNISEEQIGFLNGYANDWTVTAPIAYTNGSGGSSTYKVFLFNTPLAGEIVATIVDMIS